MPATRPMLTRHGEGVITEGRQFSESADVTHTCRWISRRLARFVQVATVSMPYRIRRDE